MSEPAARSLVHRARGTLAKIEGGRRADCGEVRDELLAAHDARRRPPARALRHLAACSACRDFRVALRAERRALRLLAPAPLLLTVIGAGGGLAARLGGASKRRGRRGGRGRAVAGVAGDRRRRGGLRAGRPGAGRAVEPGAPGARRGQGAALPRGHGGRAARRPAARGVRRAPRTLRLTCPAGLAVADLLPPSGARLDVSYAPGTVIGVARTATIRLRLGGAPGATDRHARVGDPVQAARRDRLAAMVRAGALIARSTLRVGHARAARGRDHRAPPERRAAPARRSSRRWRPGINALKTFDPPLHALDGRQIEGVRRIGKHLVVDVERRPGVSAPPDERGSLAAVRQARVAARPTSRLLIRIDRRRASCGCASSAPSSARG